MKEKDKKKIKGERKKGVTKATVKEGELNDYVVRLSKVFTNQYVKLL